MFLNDSVEHPYSGCGSCFVVSYKSKLYVVTVNHLFKNRLYTEMTTYVNENSDSLFSFNRVFSIEIPELEDDDFVTGFEDFVEARPELQDQLLDLYPEIPAARPTPAPDLDG